MRMRRWSAVKAAACRWYSVSTPTIPSIPGSGTESAERSALNRAGSFRYPDRNAQVVGREGGCLSMVQRQHSHDSVHPGKWNGERRTQRAEPGRILQISRLHRRVPVYNGLAVLRHPSRETLSQRYLQRTEQLGILALRKLRRQLCILHDVDRDGMVGDRILQLAGQQGQRVVDA